MLFIDPKRTVDFVLPEDRPVPSPDPAADPEGARRAEEENALRASRRVTFRLGVLTKREWAAIQDAMFSPTGAYQGGTDQRLTVLYGLKGWTAPDGAPAFVADKDGRPTDTTLDVLPSRVMAVLAAEVGRVNDVVSGDDLGK